MQDDAVREIHGVKCRQVHDEKQSTVRVSETNEGLTLIVGDFTAALLTPWQARYLAAKIYRLARRVRARAEAVQEQNDDK